MPRKRSDGKLGKHASATKAKADSNLGTSVDNLHDLGHSALAQLLHDIDPVEHNRLRLASLTKEESMALLKEALQVEDLKNMAVPSSNMAVLVEAAKAEYCRVWKLDFWTQPDSQFCIAFDVAATRTDARYPDHEPVSEAVLEPTPSCSATLDRKKTGAVESNGKGEGKSAGKVTAQTPKNFKKGLGIAKNTKTKTPSSQILLGFDVALLDCVGTASFESNHSTDRVPESII